LQALTQARLAAGQAWLERADSQHWFIQVLGLPAEQRSRIEDLLRNPALNENDLDNIRVYYSELSGQPRYGLIYGDYPTQEAALTALRQLPPALKAAKPYPRQVMKLRPGQG
ncbi:MAG TPA: ATPase, partial [Rhodocyclaceae bacterium]|nr:ATPase [Rhodocyclaceae bacterium]